MIEWLALFALSCMALGFISSAPRTSDPLRESAIALIRGAEGVVIDVSDAYQHVPQRRIITVTIRPKREAEAEMIQR